MFQKPATGIPEIRLKDSLKQHAMRAVLYLNKLSGDIMHHPNQGS